MLSSRPLAELFHFLIGERAFARATCSLLQRLDAGMPKSTGILGEGI